MIDKLPLANPSSFILDQSGGVGHRQLKGLLQYTSQMGQHTLEKEDERKKKLKKKIAKKQEGQ